MTKSQTAEAQGIGPASAPRANTKVERLLVLLSTGSGASLEEMTEATGWLPHTVRAAMTGLRKRGIAIERHVEGNTTVWRAGVAIAAELAE